METLKDATSIKHKTAERMPFNVRMFRGELNKSEYLLYIYQLYNIFKVIESKGLPDKDLARTKKVQIDIDELNSQGYYSDHILTSTQEYLDYLNSLPYDQILPHIYLNYMALLFGGQMIKKTVPSTGRMYDFENMPEAILSIRNVQQDEWAGEVNKGFDFIVLILDELEAQRLTV